MSEEKSTSSNSESLTIKIVDIDDTEVLYKISKSIKFQKVMTDFARKINVSLDSIKFLYDGTTIKADQTPASLELQELDTINVVKK